MKRPALLVLVVLPILAALWFLVWQPWRLEGQRDAIRANLPVVPEHDRFNAGSLRAFRAADRAARQDPLAPGAVGALGTLYHAYQVTDPARRCYRLARRLEPDDHRWSYYAAVLEKSAFRFAESETLFRDALERHPESADAWAELGDLYLQWQRPEQAAEALARALALDPGHPLAALGRARLAVIAEDWPQVIELLTPLLASHPRLSLAHRYLARAHGSLGHAAEQAHHQALAEYGSAVETSLMAAVHELAVDAIVEGGDPARGAALVEPKCNVCHTHGRIEQTEQPRRWWAGTVRRMQRLAGWSWLTDEEAADLVAFLSQKTEHRR